MKRIFSEHIFTLQWHITAQCQMRCSHCYMYDEPTYENEINNPLSLKNCLSILDDFKEFCKLLGVEGRITLTGGDPLIHKNFLQLVKEAKKREFYVGILGNPHLITREKANDLYEAGVSSYQMSLDGLEETHDRLRQKGSFKKASSAVGYLKNAGIAVGIMCTLSKSNINDILPLMEYSGKLGVDAFAFARVSSVGMGVKYRDLLISKEDYRKFLLSVEAKANELRASGINTRYRKKCHLWKLLDYERGIIELPDDNETIFGGCTMGVTGLVILSDGTVMACRRFPSFVGKVPKDKLFDIFIESEAMNSYRDYSEMEKCASCDLLQICRGCPAVSYGQTGSWKSADPQCWK